MRTKVLYIFISLILLICSFSFGNSSFDNNINSQSLLSYSSSNLNSEGDTFSVIFYEDFNKNPVLYGDWKQYIVEPATQGWQLTDDSYLGDSALIYNDAEGYQESWLVTPQIVDIPENCILEFYEKNTWVPEYYDYSGIYISTKSGNPADSQFVELYESNLAKKNYTKNIIDLSDFKEDSIYIAFNYIGNHAHEWYIDEFSIIQLPEFDAAVEDIDIANVHIEKEITASFTISNYGATTCKIPYEIFIYNLKDTIFYNKAFTDDLEKLTSTEIILPSEISFKLRDEYTCKVRTLLGGDCNSMNDSIVTTFTVTNSLWSSIASPLDPTCSILSSYYPAIHVDSSGMVQVADDITVPENELWEIDSLIVLGRVENKIQPDSFRIIIYGDYNNLPGSILYDINTTYTNRYYTYIIPVDVILNSGKYWISIMGIYNKAQVDSLQWHWICSPIQFGESAVIREDLNILQRDSGWTSFDSVDINISNISFGLFGYLKPYPVLLSPTIEDVDLYPDLDSKIVCQFNMPVKEVDFNGIQITNKFTEDQINILLISIKGQFDNILEIESEFFMYNGEFTVLIPEGAVQSKTSDKTNDSITWTFDVEIVSPISAPSKSELKSEPIIFPNPIHNTLNIISNPGSVLQLYDLTGKLILKKEATSNKTIFDLNNYPSGVYLLKIKTTSETRVLKFVKQ